MVGSVRSIVAKTQHVQHVPRPIACLEQPGTSPRLSMVQQPAL